MLIALIGLGLATGIVFATRQNGQSSGRLNVAASFYPLYDFTKNVGGDRVNVTNITPPGVEPHDYEPSAKALANAQNTALFIYNGGSLEPWTGKFLKDYKHEAVKSSTNISLLGKNDPHFWLDPVAAQQVVDNIRDGLVTVDPGNKAYYIARARQYNLQLAGLDKAYRAGLQNCRQNVVVTSHQAFSYVAARYHFEVESMAGISPEEEPSASRLAALSRLVTSKQIRYVFFESLVSPRLADTIAQETGAHTLVFDPIEGLSNADQKRGKNYLSVQRHNLQNLRIALACS